MLHPLLNSEGLELCCCPRQARRRIPHAARAEPRVYSFPATRDEYGMLQHRRRTLQYKDILDAMASTEQCDFLVDVVHDFNVRPPCRTVRHGLLLWRTHIEFESKEP